MAAAGAVVAEIELEYADRIGSDTLISLRRALADRGSRMTSLRKPCQPWMSTPIAPDDHLRHHVARERTFSAPHMEHPPG